MYQHPKRHAARLFLGGHTWTATLTWSNQMKTPKNTNKSRMCRKPRPWKPTWHWTIPMFNRKSIFIHGGLSSQSCYFSGVYSPRILLNKKTKLPSSKRIYLRLNQSARQASDTTAFHHPKVHPPGMVAEEFATATMSMMYLWSPSPSTTSNQDTPHITTLNHLERKTFFFFFFLLFLLLLLLLLLFHPPHACTNPSQPSAILTATFLAREFGLRYHR